MRVFNGLFTAVSVAYGVLLGLLLIIAICELLGSGSGAAEFRYQGF